MSIKDWATGERPREKLLERGANALSDAELLAILLRVGTQGMSAVDLSRSLLDTYGGLGGVMHASVNELSKHKGMGLAAYAQFATVLEIGRRVLSEELRQLPVFNNPQTAADYLRLKIGRERVEVSVALFLDTQNCLIACEELARGTVAENVVYPREVARLALQHQAANVLFAHNHPSGSLKPSPEDLAFTQRLQAALKLLDITLIDHMIVTVADTFSFMQHGLIRHAA
ncbi:RadC family protein [Kingella negevensis]|uniref:RadC family protein n=1 Tax=Kingella negevensis TaxID=1522312 RepID=UPI00050A18D4|nr:DNA repair protein RadC [Kingella negevensis]MDK4688840.1 DNA repair protein RadC [Kingella negevensis]WII92102.1 DNA repair protein RadC [Kingella negevensis]